MEAEIKKQKDGGKKSASVPEEVGKNRIFDTISGRKTKELYKPEDLGDWNYDEKLGNPGEYPFTRGVHPTMYRGRLWTMRQFAGFGSAFDSNERYKFLINNGQTGLSVAFDIPTLMGIDSDAQLANGEVGKCGVAIASLDDMEVLFDGIDQGKITTSMTINAPAAIIWAMYLAAGEKKGIPLEKMGGTIQNDILKEFIAQKEWVYPPEPHMKLIVDTIEFGTKYVPRWNTISISGYHIREAGSTAGQELAFTLSDGLEYVRWAVKRGIDVDDFAPRLSYFFNSHLEFFEEIAKMRAARRIWAREMKETFGAKNPRSLYMRFHTQTAGCSLTGEQPLNNIIRSTHEAMAAILGGTQSLHVNSYDEVLALPSEHAAQMSLRTQQILAFESGITNTVDPLAGSYYVEKLTDELEEEAYDYFRRIEENGGMLASIDQGFQQREIAEAAFRYQREIEKDERVIVGVNGYVTEEALPIEILQIDEEVEKLQRKRLKELRNRRNEKEALDSLKELKQTCIDETNSMPALIRASKAGCSLGEMVDCMKEVYGEYEEPPIF
ncbi:methylmalonyl-CoA mutase family protein [bacterium]|nr:methylmalonyl-CoA mutase family protein [bacterium]